GGLRIHPRSPPQNPKHFGIFARELLMLIELLQAIASGLAVGGAYALIALGFSITFTTTKTLNFAHGDFVSVGSFIGVTVLWLVLGMPINAPLAGVTISVWPQLLAAVVTVTV